MLLSKSDHDPFKDAIEPAREIGAYEYLWTQKGASFKTLADKFRNDPNATASDFVSKSDAEEAFGKVIETFSQTNLKNFNVRIGQTFDYPKTLRDARNPLELLYFLGNWSRIEMSRAE